MEGCCRYSRLKLELFAFALVTATARGKGFWIPESVKDKKQKTLLTSVQQKTDNISILVLFTDMTFYGNRTGNK